jgi:DNA polymerase III epsilon subunit-like protein
MKQYNKICVFDLETDGSDPSLCSPVQIAAVMVDPIKLEVIEDSTFNLMIKPEKLEEDPNHKYDSDILGFHAKVRGCDHKTILESWSSSIGQKQGWNMFVSYLDKYHSRSSKKTQFSAPIASGYNISRFELKIINRLSIKYGNINSEKQSDLFQPRDVLDIMNLAYYWFKNIEEVQSLALDNVRDYLGIDKDNAHDALKDVTDCANILIRFLKLHKNLANKIKFKGSFIDANV